MEYKAKLVIIGGAEDKGEYDGDNNDFYTNSILSRVIHESKKGADSRIEIITAASTVPEEIGSDYLKAFKKLKATNIGVMHVRTREEASNEKVVKRLREADIAFVTGGDQVRLTSVIGGTPFFETLAERLTDPDFLYAGTSAGAAAVSETMIAQGSSANAIRKGEIETSGGFGFVDNVLFDTHFIQRGRIGRLFQLVVSNPTMLGVGLEENTALLIKGNKMEAIGPGTAIIVDGRHIKNSNLLDIGSGAPLSIEHMIVHAMSCSDVYDIETHELKIITPEECPSDN